MDWSKGFSAAYYMTRVDPVTWADLERIEITGGSVSRTISGLRQSADVDTTEFDPDSECWIRIYLDAAQGENTTHEPLFTGLASAARRDINGTLTTYPVECYSVLKPAEDVILERGYYVAVGTYAGSLIRELLSVTPAPVAIEGSSPTLQQTIIAENGESRLSMAEKLLSAINWRMRIDGDGTIRVGPKSGEPRSTFGIDNDVIEPRVSLQADWFACPNVFRAAAGDVTAVARDDDRSSILSTVSRGREIWMAEDDVKLSSLEGLEDYARRRLREEQAYAYSVSYDRRYDPAVNVSDAVRLHYPEQGLLGDYIVVSQNIRLGNGATVSEEVQR